MNVTTEMTGFMGALLAIGMTVALFAAVVGLLRLGERIGRRREARYARQIELTDAIHRELGAIAAPTVERRPGGGWRVRMMVPLDRPATVARLLRITDRLFGPETGGSAPPYEVVLTRQAIDRRSQAGGGPRPGAETITQVAA